MLEIELKASLEGMSSEEVLHRAQSCGFVAGQTRPCDCAVLQFCLTAPARAC